MNKSNFPEEPRSWWSLCVCLLDPLQWTTCSLASVILRLLLFNLLNFQWMTSFHLQSKYMYCPGHILNPQYLYLVFSLIPRINLQRTTNPHWNWGLALQRQSCCVPGAMQNRLHGIFSQTDWNFILSQSRETSTGDGNFRTLTHILCPLWGHVQQTAESHKPQ